MTLSEAQASRHPDDSVEAFAPLVPGFPNYSNHLLDVPCSLPGWIDSVLSVGLLARSRAGLLPEPRGLPGTNGRSASTNFLSRPAQASLTLRPADLLAHLAWTLSRGSHPGRYPPSWLASYPGVPTPPGSGTLTHWWSAPLGRARSFRNFTLFGGSGLDRFKMRKPGLVYQQGRPVSVAATCNLLGSAEKT
jgi:hypothetical protein